MHDSIKDTLRRSGHTGSVTLIYKIRHDKTGDTLIYKIRNDKTGDTLIYKITNNKTEDKLIYKIRNDKTGGMLIYKIRNDKTGEKSKQLYWESASKRAEGGFERDRNNIHANKTNRHTYVYKTE